MGKDYDNPAALASGRSPVGDAIVSAQQSAQQTFSPDQVMEAYILALIETYTDNLLELVELLNRFPVTIEG